MAIDINRSWMDRILSPFLGSIPALSRSIGIDQSYIRRVLGGVKTLSPEFRKHILRVSLERQSELNNGISALLDHAPIQYKDAYHRHDVEVTAKGFALLFLRHVILRAGCDIDASTNVNKYSIQAYIADAFEDIFAASSNEGSSFAPNDYDFQRYYQFGDWEYSLPWIVDVKYSGLLDRVRNEARAVSREVKGILDQTFLRNMSDVMLTNAAINFKERWFEEAKTQLIRWDSENSVEKTTFNKLSIQVDIMRSNPEDFDMIARSIICTHWILFGEFKWQD